MNLQDQMQYLERCLTLIPHVDMIHNERLLDVYLDFLNDNPKPKLKGFRYVETVNGFAVYEVPEHIKDELRRLGEDL